MLLIILITIFAYEYIRNTTYDLMCVICELVRKKRKKESKPEKRKLSINTLILDLCREYGKAFVSHRQTEKETTTLPKHFLCTTTQEYATYRMCVLSPSVSISNVREARRATYAALSSRFYYTPLYT